MWNNAFDSKLKIICAPICITAYYDPCELHSETGSNIYLFIDVLCLVQRQADKL